MFQLQDTCCHQSTAANSTDHSHKKVLRNVHHQNITNDTHNINTWLDSTWWNLTVTAVHLLWPWSLTQKYNHYVSRPRFMWPDVGAIAYNNYEDIAFTRFSELLPAATLNFDLWPKNLIGTSMNLNTSVTKIGWNFLHCFLRHGVHGTHRLSHSQMDRP